MVCQFQQCGITTVITLLVILIIIFFTMNFFTPWKEFLYTAEQGVKRGDSPSNFNSDVINILFIISNVFGKDNLTQIVNETINVKNMNY